jgi:hypothetical protein
MILGDEPLISKVVLSHIQSFEVSLQVVTKTWFKYNEGFEGEFKFTPIYNVDYIIEVPLKHCGCYNDTRGVAERMAEHVKGCGVHKGDRQF